MKTNKMRKNAGAQKLLTRISLGIIGIGALMMVGMMYVEGEPGLIPLAAIVLGIGLYLVARYRVRTPSK